MTTETEIARRLLAERFVPTALRRSDALTQHAGAESYLKLEHELPTGSFKVRGALFALSKERERARV